MGAKGGYKRVIRFECTTCGQDRYHTKQEAVECCDEKIAEAEEKAARRTLRLNLSRVAAPRVQFVRERGDLKAVASARCPKRRCGSKYTVTVPLQNFYRTKRMSKAEAKRKAAGLVKAQIARHLQSRWGH
jgi:hypothetical protein